MNTDARLRMKPWMMRVTAAIDRIRIVPLTKSRLDIRMENRSIRGVPIGAVVAPGVLCAHPGPTSAPAPTSSAPSRMTRNLDDAYRRIALLSVANSNSEIRNPKQIQNPNDQTQAPAVLNFLSLNIR